MSRSPAPVGIYGFAIFVRTSRGRLLGGFPWECRALMNRPLPANGEYGRDVPISAQGVLTSTRNPKPQSLNPKP